MTQPDPQPLAITLGQIANLIAGLGIRTQLGDIRSITMEGTRVTVVEYRRDIDGHMVAAGTDAATITTTIAILPDPEPETP